jgi:hypothetical protein
VFEEMRAENVVDRIIGEGQGFFAISSHYIEFFLELDELIYTPSVAFLEKKL